MVFTHKIVCRKSPKLYASYHDQTLKKTCFNLTERAALNLPNNSQGTYSSRPHNSSTPGGSGRLPVSSVPVSCGKGNRPACALWAAVVYMVSLSCVLRFFVAVLPERISGVGTLPGLRDILSRSGSLRCFPCRGIPFGRSFCFQGAAHR